MQPRHTYAVPNQEGHIHLSSPLMIAAARVLAARPDLDFRLLDENFGVESRDMIEADIVALNLVGAPYIPRAIDIIRRRVRSGAKVILGGQICSSLNDEEFATMFGMRDDVELFNGNDDKNLRQIFELSSCLPSKESVSQVQVWEKISEDKMSAYLSREFSFYVSQGCAYNCDFCQADKAKPEKYRDLKVIKEDLTYLAGKAVSLGLDRISFYMSNLDAFQTPTKLLEFAGIIEEVKIKFKIDIQFRCLATLECFLRAKEIIPILKKAGLKSVGFGVDGGTAEVLASVNKKHNIYRGNRCALQKASDAISLCAENDIIPEILMVFGHPGETEESLKSALDFVREMAEKYKALPRPHVAKHIIPGAKEWRNPQNTKIVQHFIHNPDYFQATDYAALASELTHPDAELRALTNKYYLAMCKIREGSTQWIYPDTPEFRAEAVKQGTTIEALNQGRFDR